MIERVKLASIECAQCSALLEVYSQRIPGKPILEWITRDGDLCKSSPLDQCPNVRAEVERRFPGFEG